MSDLPKHIQAISDAWKAGKCRAVKDTLGLPSTLEAGRLVSNLRRKFPDAFPRQRGKVGVSTQAVLRRVVALLSEHPEPWAQLAVDMLTPLQAKSKLAKRAEKA